jgi:hypothetical protein
MKWKDHLLSGFGLQIALCSTFLPAFAQVQPDKPYHYIDDHDGRRLASIEIKLHSRGDRPVLQLVISAVGPLVEPMPGFAGLRGANRQTAEQIEAIMKGKMSFVVLTIPADGGAPQVGTWQAGVRARIRERQFLPNGRIDFFTLTEHEYPIELLVETGAMADGAYTTELWFDDEPRLRVSFQISGHQLALASIASLGRPDPARAPPKLPPGAIPQTKEQEAQKGPVTPPVADADWNARDQEGKWVLFRKIVGDNDEKAAAFVAFLAQRKDFEFLEWIGVYQPLRQGGLTATGALAKADAPQWLRVAAWQRLNEITHGEAETARILRKHNPPKALAWLEKYGREAALSKEEKEGAMEAQNDLLMSDLSYLRGNKVKVGDLGTALPPLSPGMVFDALAAPADLPRFGGRLKAEPGKTYQHQVLRAISAVVQSGRYREPWVGKLATLTKHSNTDVRLAALLAFADIGNWLDPKVGLIDEFRKMMDDPKEPAGIREGAFMAFSAFAHPQVFVRIHELLLQPENPCWFAAMSRIYNVGDQFTLDHLKRLDRAKLSPKAADVYDANYADLEKWAEQARRSRAVSKEAVESKLARAAWAQHTNSAIAKNLVPWTIDYFVKQPDNVFVEHLTAVANEYEPDVAAGDAADLRRLVREMARTILNASKKR